MLVSRGLCRRALRNVDGCPDKDAIVIRIVCLYDRRRKGARFRVGAVRYPPRGKRVEDRDEYDVWLPELAPTSELMRSYREGAVAWDQFLRRYRSQANKPEARHLIALLAAVSKVTNLSVGCYCEEEAQCHRQVLRELLADAGADLA